ncbi:MAG: replication-associated recombination protein A, partial [Flavobacteriales bacterium]
MINKTPLAERLRPTSLETYMGQEKLIGEGASLRKAIESGFIPSLILWGPPGVGKTTLANIIANTLERPFYTLSAISSGVKDIRDIINRVKSQGMFGGNNAILFIDEIHRFSKSQQDSLLGAVEKGIITLIGATTENPSFEVIPALLSRSQVYVLEHFSKENLENLIQKAVSEDKVLAAKKIKIEETDALIGLSGGDARKLLNLLELVINSSGDKVVLNNELVNSLIKDKTLLYDKSGEQHYDVISAFIKSIRGSDPNAALYYLARMIEGGEDPKFIARRLLILSSEDIGNANPTALVIANNCFQAVNIIGFPESRIILSQCVTYLACSAKSNASYVAISDAQKLVNETGNLPIPLHLRNAPTKLMKEL